MLLQLLYLWYDFLCMRCSCVRLQAEHARAAAAEAAAAAARAPFVLKADSVAGSERAGAEPASGARVPAGQRGEAAIGSGTADPAARQRALDVRGLLAEVGYALLRVLQHTESYQRQDIASNVCFAAFHSHVSHGSKCFHCCDASSPLHWKRD